MQHLPKPGPGAFKNVRSTAIPRFQGKLVEQPHGFSNNLSRSGDPDLIGYTDTGFLFSLGAADDHAVRLAFLDAYQGRLLAHAVIFEEVTRWAIKQPSHLSKDEAAKPVAAKTAQRALLTGAKIKMFDEVDTQILNGILDQLREYSAYGNWTAQRDDQLTAGQVAQLEEHAGEAVLIAHAATHGDGILLTNDAGASAIAQNRGVKAWHYGQVLRQLVCRLAAPVSVQQAARAFAEAMCVAAIRKSAQPSNLVAWLTCARLDDGSCLRCSSV